MMRGMGIRIQDAFNQRPFRKKKHGPKVGKSRLMDSENLASDLRITYLSSRQLEEAAKAEKYLLENLDDGSDFKNLFFLQHQFLIIELEEPSFCDLCGLLIWGVYRLSLKCRNCSLISHPQCKQFLRLACPKPRLGPVLLPPGEPQETGILSENEQEDEALLSTDYPNGNSYGRPLLKKVQEFNDSFPFAMLQLEMDGSYTGFVKIILRLKRPITVSTGPFPGARVTSFYLPRNSEKVVHVSSLYKTPDVILAILSKFRIRDDPRKFSLHLEDRDGAKRLSVDEYPLQIVLKARELSCDCCRLILEETNTKKVLWDAFTLPELENFRIILNREEDEWMQLVQRNYALYRSKLQAELDACAVKDLSPEQMEVHQNRVETGV